MKKENRQSLIQEIIFEQRIENQQQLLEELAQRGVDATQATISRDIKELRIVKTNDNEGNIKYSVLPETQMSYDARLQEVLRDSVSEITQVGFMNIVKTLLGTADIVGAEIDELELPEIVGTLAGTDAIVLISTSEIEAKRINQQLMSYLN